MRMGGLSYNSGTENRYRYNGKEYHQELNLGLYDYGARFYDPSIARWTSIDPLADIAPNKAPYHFVSNNPINRIDPDGLTDFTVNKKTGEITQVGETNDEPDRILRTNKKGEVKYKKNGEAKVAIDDISKGILEDGLNLQENDGTFEVNGEGQPTLEEFNSFISEFSDYVGKEITGIRLGKADSEQTLRVKTHKYKNSTKVESQTPRSWLTRYGDFLKGHFHTHPYHDHSPSEKDEKLKSEFPDIPFFIIAGGHEKKF